MPVFRAKLNAMMAKRQLETNEKVTQVWLAEKIGVSESTISRYAANIEAAPLSNIRQICVALNCKVGDLLYLDEEAPDPPSRKKRKR